jgi:hypothetical protein
MYMWKAEVRAEDEAVCKRGEKRCEKSGKARIGA